jgi:hypothetical protein
MYVHSFDYGRITMGDEDTNAEIVAHVLATAPISYKPVTTLVHGRDLKNKNILNKT